MNTGPSRNPPSSSHVVPVISPLPLSENQPANTGSFDPLPRGRMAVTPVRTGPDPIFKAPLPEMSVVIPTSTPATSVIAFTGPGCPWNGTPRSRARDLGVPFHGQPGPVNAITDVAGVEVGITTLISGSGALKIGSGPVRTGVTAILPRGKGSNDPVFAGWFSLNGNGEMTGTTWLEEGGFLEGPVFITNTHSVGVVRDAAIKWSVDHGYLHQPWSLPVVAEKWDGSLNDINRFHVNPEHVVYAIT